MEMHATHRRLRRTKYIRDLVAETTLRPADLIQPFFVVDGQGVREEILTLPGNYRLSKDILIDKAKEARDLGIKFIVLFPKIEQSLKSADGDYAINPQNFIFSVIAELKAKVPDMGIIADVALDPYTLSGHDGILDRAGLVDNRKTVEMLGKMSCALAASGVDVVAPSDMMDQRVGFIRDALLKEGHEYTLIFSYAVKFASAFYGPFRDAVQSKLASGYLDKNTYQLDFRNAKEAIKDALVDEDEGADALIIKPGLPYLDILKEVAEVSALPVLSYHVSGEYAMLKVAAREGIIDFEKGMTESLVAFKRAGAQAIITYAALEIAALL